MILTWGWGGGNRWWVLREQVEAIENLPVRGECRRWERSENRTQKFLIKMNVSETPNMKK